MLKFLRKRKIMKRIFWALVILLLPPFVLWGAGNIVRSGKTGPKYIGKIYGKKISFKRFAGNYEACMHYLILSSGGDPTVLNQMMGSININQMAWERIVLLEEARRRHIKAADSEVADLLSRHPIFARRGAFDKQFYNYILTNTLRTSPLKFEGEMRENIVIDKLRKAVIKDIAVTDEELLDEYKRENEKIKISFLLVDPKAFEKDIPPEEPLIRTFYERIKEAYRKGEEANIRYIYIDSNDIDLLSRANEELSKNTSLDEFAQKNNLAIEETGFFGMDEEIPKIGWSYEVAAAAFDLKKGATSYPVYTPKGYYIINVKEKRTGRLPAFEEIESKVKIDYIKSEAFELAKKEASKIYTDLNEALKNGFGFEEAAKKSNMTVHKSAEFSRRDYIEGLGQAEAFKESAFALEKGRITQPITCEKGIVIAKIDERMPADKTKFAEEKEKLSEQLLSRKKAARLNEWFGEILKNTELAVDLNSLQN